MILRIERVDGHANRLSLKGGTYAHLRLNKDLTGIDMGIILQWAGRHIQKYTESGYTGTIRKHYQIKEGESAITVREYTHED